MIDPDDYFFFVKPTKGFWGAYAGTELIKELYTRLGNAAKEYFTDAPGPAHIAVEANDEEGVWKGIVRPRLSLAFDEKNALALYTIGLEIRSEDDLFGEPDWGQVVGWIEAADNAVRLWWVGVEDEARYAGSPIRSHAHSFRRPLLVVSATDDEALDSLIFELDETLEDKYYASWKRAMPAIGSLEQDGVETSDIDRLKSRVIYIDDWDAGLLQEEGLPDENGAVTGYCSDISFDRLAFHQMWRNGHPSEAFEGISEDAGYREVSAPKGSRGRLMAIFATRHDLLFEQKEGAVEVSFALIVDRAWGDFTQRSLANRLATEAAEIVATIGQTLVPAAKGMETNIVFNVRLTAVGVVAATMKPKLEAALANIEVLARACGMKVRAGEVRLDQLAKYVEASVPPLSLEPLVTPLELSDRVISLVEEQMPEARSIKVLDFNTNARRPDWLDLREARGRRTYLPFLILSFLHGESLSPQLAMVSTFGMVVSSSIDQVGARAAAVVRAMERVGAGLFYGRGPDIKPNSAMKDLTGFLAQIAPDGPRQPMVPYEATALVSGSAAAVSWFEQLDNDQQIIARAWLLSQNPDAYPTFEKAAIVRFSAADYDFAVSAAQVIAGPSRGTIEDAIARYLALTLVLVLGAPRSDLAERELAGLKDTVEQGVGTGLFGDPEARLFEAMATLPDRAIGSLRDALAAAAVKIVEQAPSPTPAVR